MAEIGRLNQLEIIKELRIGLILDGEELGEILLPKKYVPKTYEIGEKIKVFIYFDSEDRLVATTQTPYAMVGDFALLKVIAVHKIGVFLDWGLAKDLLVPSNEQLYPMDLHEFHIVKIFLDKRTKRITASSRMGKFINRILPEYDEGEEVDLMIFGRTELGYKAIVNGDHWGLLYENEVFQKLKRGQRIKGFVKQVREDDKIDLSLYKPGYDKVEGSAKEILNLLKEKGGFLPVTDKSPPELIYDTFGFSKKTFKKSVGNLYKQRLITIDKNGITLTK